VLQALLAAMALLAQQAVLEALHPGKPVAMAQQTR
jgi:hypothetical protein